MGIMSFIRSQFIEIVEWLDEGRHPYLFVHQPENLDSPGLARRIHEAIREQRSGLAPLPDPLAVVDHEQGELFGDG